MTDLLLSRRAFLIGCSVAASPLVTPVSFASASGENRLVVIVLRGAMDGLDVVRPVGDTAFAGLRPTLSANPGPALNDFFTLHPAAESLMPLWKSGELGFAHAVATPYRQGRSHFIGQDALENGTDQTDGTMTSAHDGWLNRAIGLMKDATPETGVSVGQQRLLVLEGDAPSDHWFPVEESQLSGQGAELIAALNAADPLFAEPFAEAQRLADTSDGMTGGVPRGKMQYAQLGTYVAQRLMGPSRIASFSLGGWDMHRDQVRSMAGQLKGLSDAILAMKEGLGRAWGTTLVIGITEFGRTARENGTGGTDHGTGGLAVLAGGALKGGHVYGKWPGLGESDLFENRDLLPTADVRAFPAWALRSMFGLEAAGLEATVFPGLDLGSDPGFLL
ncbi:DUF1501 domain-containing protein [Stagnihabitans tardus]|uniref:DUF1501 domain-containing protein n=1 Tax=Stagnihabitans tardus TaxID=2699202 RepID=A0AAE4YBF0_9RHOB|nr:DUF1501 domain-containing protein [Stagnihabitans tardus]NBZ88148.1 DUF1501 domain-containing protein [Stagnihabitans tardus]